MKLWGVKGHRMHFTHDVWFGDRFSEHRRNKRIHSPIFQRFWAGIFILQLELAWNYPWSPGWPEITNYPIVSACWVLGRQSWARAQAGLWSVARGRWLYLVGSTQLWWGSPAFWVNTICPASPTSFPPRPQERDSSLQICRRKNSGRRKGSWVPNSPLRTYTKRVMDGRKHFL